MNEANTLASARYPIELERELLAALRAGKPDRAGATLDSIADHLREHRWRAILCRQLCSHLLLQGLNVAWELKVIPDGSLSPTLELGAGAWAALHARVRQHLIQLAALIGRAATNGSSATVRRALRYVQRNYHTNLTLSQVAEHVCLSSNYLSELIRRATGRTFSDLLTELRIEEAKRLLQRGDLNVSQVCYRVGYGNPRYFSEIFHRQVRLTPREYRRLPDANLSLAS